MNRSESITKLAPSLLKAQKAIKAALKDSTNPHFKSKYADLSSVIDAVKSSLNEQGIVFLQGVGHGEHGVTVETMLLHESGEWMSSTLEIPLGKMDAQGVGSATTYGRRYGLQAMCGVPAEDDDGNAATERPKAIQSVHKPTDGAWEAMTPDLRIYLTDLSGEARKIMSSGDFRGAAEHINEAGLDSDQKTALWTLFDSKERSALKKAFEEIRKVAA